MANVARSKATLGDTEALEPYLLNLARAAADKRRTVKETLTWRAALDEAPWSSKLPAAWESAFRRAYAERLAERGIAAPAAKAGTTSGKGGKTELKGRLVYMTPDELTETAARAKAAGVPWSTWARRKLTAP